MLDNLIVCYIPSKQWLEMIHSKENQTLPSLTSPVKSSLATQISVLKCLQVPLGNNKMAMKDIHGREETIHTS
jgi:hypothetical protein